MHPVRLKFYNHIIIHSSHFVSTGGAQRLQAQFFFIYSISPLILQINLYMLTNTTVHIPITIHMFLSFQFILNLIIVNRIKCINIQFFVLKLYKYTEIKKRMSNTTILFYVHSACFSPTWLLISSLIMFLISFLISVPN